MYSSKKYIDISHGDIAQLARAPALQAGGQEFDSPQLHHLEVKPITSKIHSTLKNI